MGAGPDFGPMLASDLAQYLRLYMSGFIRARDMYN